MSGFWFACFACEGAPSVLVTMYGDHDGMPVRLRRAACSQCATVLLLGPFPIHLTGHSSIRQVTAERPYIHEDLLWDPET